MTYNVFGGTLNPAQSNPIRQRVVYEMLTLLNFHQVQARSNIKLYRCYLSAGIGNVGQHAATPKRPSGMNAPGKVYLILTLTLTLVLCVLTRGLLSGYPLTFIGCRYIVSYCHTMVTRQ